MTFSIGIILLIVVAAGVLAILSLLQSPRSVTFLAVAVFLLSVVEVIEHTGGHQ